MFITAAFSAGILAQRLSGIPIFYLLSACSIFLLFSFIINKKTISGIFLVLSIISLGSIFYQNANDITPGHISNFLKAGPPQKALIKGVIVTDPTIKQTRFGGYRTEFTLSAEELKLDKACKAAGLVSVLLYTNIMTKVEYADELILEGELYAPRPATNPGVFDYRAYLKDKYIYASFKSEKDDYVKVIQKRRASILNYAAYRLRHKVMDLFNNTLPEPNRYLLSKIILGDAAGYLMK